MNSEPNLGKLQHQDSGCLARDAWDITQGYRFVRLGWQQSRLAVDAMCS